MLRMPNHGRVLGCTGLGLLGEITMTIEPKTPWRENRFPQIEESSEIDAPANTALLITVYVIILITLVLGIVMRDWVYNVIKEFLR